MSEGKPKPKRNPTFENTAQIFDRVKTNVRQRTAEPEFSWFIDELDRITHGIIRGKMVIIGARTSEGKTSLAMQTALKNADCGKVVAYVSLEDDKEQLVEKLYCQLTTTNNQELKRGVSTERLDDPTIMQVMENIPLLVVDNFGYEFDEIRTVVKDLDPKPDLLVVDYIQMIEGEGFKKRFEAISEFARKLQRFCKAENIGCILVSQINRQGAKDGRPRLHHLADSGTLEQTADQVVLMYLPWKYDDTSFDYSAIKEGKRTIVTSGMEKCPPNYLEIEVAKNKTGPIGVATAEFKKHCYQILDWTQKSRETDF